MEEKITHKFNNWEYNYFPNRVIEKRYEVIPQEEKEFPEILCKYYSLSNYNIEAIEQSYLFASAQQSLNDPFDCMNVLIDTNKVSDEFIIRFYQNFLSNEQIHKEFNDLKDHFNRNLFKYLYQHYGIVSLTPDYINLQMWAYYASSHHGVVVKFKSDGLKIPNFIGPFPLNYSDEWEPIDINKGNALSFLYHSNIKSTNWEHENEWRILGIGDNMSYPRYKENETTINNRKFKYDISAIDEIVLGFKFIDRLVKKNRVGNTMIIDFSENVPYNEEKRRIIEFISKNNVKVSWCTLKERINTFELTTIPIRIRKKDEFRYFWEEELKHVDALGNTSLMK